MNETATQCPRVRKVWGWTTQIEPDLHFLELEKGGYCSQHFHEQRANLFAVHSGIVEIDQWMGSLDMPKGVILRPGEKFEVPSLVVHRFHVIESGTMTELYYADRGGVCDPDDIVRLVEGGKNDEG